MVLHVAGSTLGIGDDGVEGALALELAEDLLVRHADDVDERVQAAAVRHAEHDLLSARVGGELDGLVEDRDGRVETLDGELLLAEERAPQEALEALDLRKAPEQLALLVRPSG